MEHYKKLLLIAEAPEVVQQVQQWLRAVDGIPVEWIHAPRLTIALDHLKQQRVEAIFLALVKQSGTSDGLAALQQLAPRIPILVLIAAQDELQAGEWLRDGAQECLIWEELTARSLGRALAYSCARQYARNQVHAQEESLQRYAERLKNLQEVDRAILGAGSPEAVAAAALSRLRQLIPCRRVLVVELDLSGRARLLAAETGRDIPLGGVTELLREICSADALKAGHTLGIEDLAAVTRRTTMQQALYNEGVRSYMLAPLHVQHTLIGVLYIESDRRHAFAVDHVDIANEIAFSLAIAIRQARLYQQTLQDAQTKEVLLEEINHRVKNNLLAVVGLIQLERQAGAPHEPLYAVFVDRLINRIEGLAAVNRMLAAAEWSLVSLSELTEQIIYATLKVGPMLQTVKVSVVSSLVWVSPRQASSLALILHELTSNSLTHALGAVALPALSASITTHEQTVCLEFRDNGPGYPEDVLLGGRRNVGLYLIRRLVRFNLRGTLTLYNDQGAVIRIEFQKGVVSDT